MGKIYEYLRGYYIVTRSAEKAVPILDLLVKNSVPFYGVHRDAKENITFRLGREAFSKYLSVTGHIPPDDEQVRRVGLFAVLPKYKTRIGFFIGAVIFAFIIAASSFFVWDINIDGECSLSEDEILSVLEDFGIYHGAYIPSIDTAETELRLVVALEPLSYASINLRGTVAEVVVREEKTDIVDDSNLPSNLIADRDGQIETIELLGGMPAVKRGQIVKKGQLLASGVIDSQALGYRLVRARGNIYARVSISLDSEVPLEEERKTYTGNEITLTKIKIFSKNINLFANKEISFEKYDTIERETRVCLFDLIELPIFVTKTVCSEYVLETAVQTEEEATEKARRDILAQSAEIMSDATLLTRYTDISSDEKSVKIHCDIECIMDIAREVPIETGREK